jgi:hypothetical protein
VLIVVTAAAFLLLGREISLRAWPALGAFERACFAAAAGMVLWIGTIWVFAVFHLMTPVVMVLRTVAVAAAAAILWFRSARRDAAPLRAGRPPALVFIAAGPVVLWLAFVLYRGAILPPVSHDALAYHLPKAILFERADGYEFLADLDARIRNIPANYELLLTDAIVSTGSDGLTEWISTLLYVLFVVAAAALAERWWKSPKAAVVVGLFASGVPVALLHSGAHKNDLMVSFFIVAALVAAGRWIERREFATLMLVIVSFAAAIGTKPQAAGVALCVAPFVIWKMSLRQVVMGAGIAVAAILLLGGAVYLYNFANERDVIGVGGIREASTVIAYGDWPNLWQAPYVLLAAPFAPHPRELPVPWEADPWFWRRYEVFFSHLGVLFSLCAVVAPVMMFRFRGNRERAAITIAAVAAFVLMLPVQFLPHGMFAISLPRYALFMVPVLFSWAVGPLERFALPLAGLGAAVFVWYAIDNARNDTFAPFEYVKWIRQHPGNRSIPFDPFRAASVADRRAGPDDTIAIDAAFGTWIYPAFGAELTRPVKFIAAGAGPPHIPQDAQWVVVDRGYSSIWEHPDFRDLSQARQFLVRGKPKPEELRVLNAMRADERFETVFYNPITNQAVFRRIQ